MKNEKMFNADSNMNAISVHSLHKNVSNKKSMNNTFLTPSLKNWFVGLMITAVALLSGVQRSFAQSASTVTVGGTSSVNSISNNFATVVDAGLTISANGNITNFSVIITGSYTTGDLLNYTGTLPTGVTTPGFSAVTKSITFTGTTSAANWQTFLRTVRLQTTSATCFPESRQVTFVAGGALYNPLNDHYYMLNPTNASWTDSKATASNTSFFGLQGYLATITSAAENSFISVMIGSNSWIGCSDNYLQINSAVGYILYANQAASEGYFYWVTGPEAGTQMRTGNAVNQNNYHLGSPIAGVYQNWRSQEPNDYNLTNFGDEDYGHMYSGTADWNDFPNGSVLPAIFEFGGMPNDILNSTIKYTRNIYVNGAPTSGISGGGGSVCASVGTTTLTINSFVGTVIRWESSLDNFISGNNITTIANTTTSLTVSNPSQTTYYRAVVTTGSCPSQATSPVAINVTTTQTGNLNSANSTICTGGTFAVNLYGNNGSVLNWQSGSSSTGPWTNITNTTTTLSQTGSSTGTTYYRAQVQSSCGSPAYTTAYPIVIVTGTPPVGGSVNNVWACPGSQSGTVTLAGSTGSVSKWQYSIDGGIVWTDVTNTTNTLNYSGVTSNRTYRAVLTSGSCGTALSTGGAIQFYTNPPTGATISINDQACGNTATGSFNSTIVGGTAPLTYVWQWSPDNVNWYSAFTAPIVQPTGATPTNIYPGYFYRVTVTDANNCSITSNGLAMTAATAMTISATATNVSCYGASTGVITAVTTNGTAPFVVSASNGTNTYTQSSYVAGSGGQKTFTISNLPAGTYTVSAVDGPSSCNPSTTVTITQPGQLAITGTQTNVTCNGATTGAVNLSLTATGSTSSTAVTFAWSNSATSEDLSNLAAGTYSVTATNACAQTATASFTITEPAILAGTVAATDVTVCYGNNNGSIVVNGSTGGAGTYQYSINGTNWQTSNTFSNLTAGTYQVSMRDAVNTSCVNDLDASNGTVLGQPTELSATVAAVNVTLCNGNANGSITVSGATGGSGSFEYSINGTT